MPEQKTKFDDGRWKHEIRKISDLHLDGFEKLAEWGLQ